MISVGDKYKRIVPTNAIWTEGRTYEVTYVWPKGCLQGAARITSDVDDRIAVLDPERSMKWEKVTKED